MPALRHTYLPISTNHHCNDCISISKRCLPVLVVAQFCACIVVCCKYIHIIYKHAPDRIVRTREPRLAMNRTNVHFTHFFSCLYSDFAKRELNLTLVMNSKHHSVAVVVVVVGGGAADVVAAVARMVDVGGAGCAARPSTDSRQ